MWFFCLSNLFYHGPIKIFVWVYVWVWVWCSALSKTTAGFQLICRSHVTKGCAKIWLLSWVTGRSWWKVWMWYLTICGIFWLLCPLISNFPPGGLLPPLMSPLVWWNGPKHYYIWQNFALVTALQARWWNQNFRCVTGMEGCRFDWNPTVCTGSMQQRGVTP